MLEIIFDKSFRVNFSKRVPISSKIYDRVIERIKKFSNDPDNPILADHPLKGSMFKFRSFSVTKEIRIIYQICGDQLVKFIDIGTHEQVYKK